MLTTLKYRRHIAVLAALAMVASVLVAAPAVAADDPKPDYTATFSACDHDAVEPSDFEDVSAGHANAGDIDCIAYYTITKGTSATTYSPSMAVSREHMALFLTRLAGLVGIEVTSTPDDPGFTDTGDLPAESQTAIAQLADLGITRGTSETTYSPADSVTRGQMALFIQRLMNQMDVFADPDAAEEDDPFGYKPEDVTGDDVGSPYNDLGSTTKTAYDAITALYELGVVSGITDTAYGPGRLITRAWMAEFMAGVLDHSNARPTGISMQAKDPSDFGEVSRIIAISYRDDSFAPMVDVSIKTFDIADVGVLNEEGQCADEGDCSWSDSELLTDARGNLFVRGTVTIPTATDNSDAENTWYAWMGDEENTVFDKDDSNHASVTLSAKTQALGFSVIADTNKEASGDGQATATAWQVDIGKDSAVVLTLQLIDNSTNNAEGAKAVAKEGVEIDITYQQGSRPLHPGPGSMKTDADGKITFTVTGPEKDDDDTTTQVTRVDQVTFTADVEGNGTDTTPDNENVDAFVSWQDGGADLTKGTGSGPDYAIIDDGEVSVRGSVSYYDQYGNPAAQGGTVTITVTSNSTELGVDTEDAGEDRTINSRGMATYRGKVDAEAGNTITIAFSDDPEDSTNSAIEADDETLLAVVHADKGDATAAAIGVTEFVDDDRFIGSADEAGTLYSYDADDIFILDDEATSMDEFEEALEANATVQIVAYSSDGVSIFSATSAQL